MIYKYKGHTIEMYDSIHDLPILRFQRFNKYQMISNEIGNTFEDYDRRMAKTIQFLEKKMIDEAKQELQNQRQTVFNSYNNFTPVGKSLAVLVKRIDKTIYDTFTPDDLDRCLEHLDKIGLDYGTAIEKLLEVKKKSKRNWLCTIQNSFRRMGTRNKRHSESKELESSTTK